MQTSGHLHADLLVVGGGLAGLSAAALVARAGRSVIVLERAGHLGGRAATHVDRGIHFNLGPHALYRRGAAFRLFQELKVPFTGRFPNPGRGLLLDGEAAYSLIQGPASLLASRLLTLREKWRLARLLGSIGRLDARPLDRVPLATWLAERAGAGKLAALLRALFRVSTYTDDPGRMSAGAAIDQLRLALAGNVWYLDDGWQSLVDGLRDAADGHGAQIRTGARVESVRCDADGVDLDLSGGDRLRGRAAILAVPPDVACRLLDLPDDAPLARWSAGRVPIQAACLDVALSDLPRPETRFALGLDRPLYYSVHSTAARLAPSGVAVLHAMKYLGGEESGPSGSAEGELEDVLDRLQPGWRDRVIERRFLPA
jgi:phytoene dehydrogenase-like protein